MDVAQPKSISGFTLFELVLIILILGILSVAVLPRLPSRSSMTIAAQADQIANDIRFTQTLSMTNAQSYYLIFPTTTTYQILDATGTPILFASGSDTMSLGSGLSVQGYTNLTGTIAFDGLGIPYIDSAATTTLASQGAAPHNGIITLTGSGGASAQIVIRPETGSVYTQ